MKSSNEDKQRGQALANCQPVACPTPIPQPRRSNCGSLGGSTEGGRDSQPARLERPGNRISLEGKCKML